MNKTLFIFAAIILAQVIEAQTPGTLKWKFANENTLFYGSPAIDDSGTVYIGCENNTYSIGLYAIDSVGNLKWEFENKGTYNSSSIGHDGTIYFPSNDSSLYAINSDGTIKWQFKTDGWYTTTPAIGIDSTIYFGSSDNNLYAINSDGTKKWEYAAIEWIGPPAIGKDGTIYFTSDTILSAINPDGTKKWEYTTGDFLNDDGLAIGSDGTVYVGDSKNFYAISPEGKKKWEFYINDWISTPAIGSDGTIYVGSSNIFYAINPNGTKKWEYVINDWVSAPAIGNYGVVYVVDKDGDLYALNPDGTKKWEFKIDYGSGSGSPAISVDGVLYVGTNAIFTESEGLANSPWPKFQCNNKNTGYANISSINAEFVAEPISGETPLLVQFTNNSSGEITSWQWDFGDGGTSTEQNPSYTYTVAGTYTVSLTVTGAGGSDTETKTDYITVNTPTGISDFTTEDKILIFPNPTKAICKVIIPNEISGNVDIKIFSNNGETLISKTGTSDKFYDIDLSNLTTGIYYIYVISENNILTDKLIIVE